MLFLSQLSKKRKNTPCSKLPFEFQSAEVLKIKCFDLFNYQPYVIAQHQYKNVVQIWETLIAYIVRHLIWNWRKEIFFHIAWVAYYFNSWVLSLAFMLPNLKIFQWWTWSIEWQCWLLKIWVERWIEIEKKKTFVWHWWKNCLVR